MKKQDTVLGFPLVRTDRKTVGITVRPGGEVQVRAPKRMKYADIERAVRMHADWLQKAVIQMQNKPPAPKIDKKQQEFLRTQAKKLLPVLVDYWAKRIGVTPTGLKITSAKKRYGSCSGKNSLCFSLFLMQSPMDSIEYVVVHELCHIRHHNHSCDFWAMVEQYLPDYRDRKKNLV